MKLVLVVMEPFASYERGAMITDQQTIDDVLKSDHAIHVVKALRPDDEPAQEAAPMLPDPSAQ